MSLKQEERDIMVGLELEKADSTFAEQENQKVYQRQAGSNLKNRKKAAL